MYTEEELEKLESEEMSAIEESLLAIALIISKLRLDVRKELISFYQKYGSDGVVTYKKARQWVSSTDHRKRIFVLY